MPGNSFGKLFKITTWGESHGKGVGVVIDGCPPGISITEAAVQAYLNKRKPGTGAASTSRREKDRPIILSGVFEGKTTGTPISVMIENIDAQSSAYEPFSDLFRPGHGDYTYQKKYGIRDWRGGGRASARETAARVAAGAIANVFLEQAGIRVTAYTLELGGVRADAADLSKIQENPYCCPDPEAVDKIDALVAEVRRQGNSLGGVVEVAAMGVPAGLGDPVFDKMDADLAKALMSIGAVKGVEIGAGFEACRMLGSENNDPITPNGFASNNAGGILAGISNGEDIAVRVAVKPIPSISLKQQTIDAAGKPRSISIKGRHDICAIPRINVVCESMVALVLADHMLRHRAIAPWE